jgi:hypothetical protein
MHTLRCTRGRNSNAVRCKDECGYSAHSPFGFFILLIPLHRIATLSFRWLLILQRLYLLTFEQVV